MGIVNIPAYMYFGTNLVTKQVNMSIHCDDGIVSYMHSKYSSSQSRYRVLDSTGLNETNLLTYVNAKVGELLPLQNTTNLIARNLEMYCLHKDSVPAPHAYTTKLIGLTGCNLTIFDINYDLTKITTLNGFNIQELSRGNYIGTYTQDSGGYQSLRFFNSGFKGFGGGGNVVAINERSRSIQIIYNIYPEGIFTTEGVNIDYPDNLQPIEIQVDAECNEDLNAIISCTVYISTEQRGMLTYLQRAYNDFTSDNSGINETDAQNPYAYDGNSTTGGGDGKYDTTSDGLTAVPDLPTIDAADLGFVTMYNPTKAQLKQLADFMWSNAFDLNTYKKLFSDPMDSIIGLAIVPVSPSVGGSKNVMFGTIDSGVNMDYLSSQYVKVDCGSVDIDKYVGSFLDYDYTKISIYLPYIGFRQLDADDVMGHTISVEYNVDCLSGACAAFISVSDRGVMYSYNGSCISNVPLTASNFSGAIQNAVSAIISAGGVVAGAATGAAPLTAMGAAGLLSSAANTALNSKPDIQRSGNLGGSAGILSVQHPFVIIQRPDVSVPSNIENYVGQTSNITMNLQACHGFTMVEYIHLHDIDATADEVAEIENILKGGAIL